ncbi:MAG: SBBP repeat-containing protein, partial [Brevinematia bacterium]
NVYVAGRTYSTDFPTTSRAYDTSFNGGGSDAFISKFDANLSSLLASTFLGGSDNDAARAIAIDSSGNVYVAGDTDSKNFPTTSRAYDTSFNSVLYSDAFISKFDANLSSLLASTFLGGSYWDEAHTLAIDSSGNVYVAGRTESTDFPTTPGAYDTSYNGMYVDAFISKFDANLSSLLASTYLGGSSDDEANAIAIDSSGNVYVAGYTAGYIWSTDFPTT